VEDFNGGDNAGCGYFQVNQRRGLRWSSARAFLKPALGRANLTLLTGVRVDRVLFEGRRAVGVEYARGDERWRAKAEGETILAAGAVGSPILLQRSGVGPAAELRALGLEVTADAPGVGANLQDHLQIRPVFKVSGVTTLNSQYASLWRRALMGLEYGVRRTGPLTMAPSQLGAFAKSSPERETPDLQFHFQPLSLAQWGAGLDPFDAFTASVCNLRPTSRGRVMLTGPAPEAAPLIDPNYLATAEDRGVAVRALRLARRIVGQPALAAYAPQEFKPGAELASDEALLEAAQQLGTTIFHPVGSAAMGAADDPLAVLDERLRVRGVTGLRVIDASAMPRITSGNTNAPTMMIAEKGAAMVLEDAGAGRTANRALPGGGPDALQTRFR
jgi:choline dehydrogenase-like flavoprotein